jgi:sulfur-carrier protein
MSTRVHLYTSLQQYTGGHNQASVQGSTVGECLNDLVRQYPDIGPVLFDKNGRLHSIVFVSVNMNSVNPEKLDRTVQENDALYIILIIAGG